LVRQQTSSKDAEILCGSHSLPPPLYSFISVLRNFGRIKCRSRTQATVCATHRKPLAEKPAAQSYYRTRRRVLSARPQALGMTQPTHNQRQSHAPRPPRFRRASPLWPALARSDIAESDRLGRYSVPTIQSRRRERNAGHHAPHDLSDDKSLLR